MSWRDAERWLAGRELFTRAHQESDGLGAPGFNAESCAFCHKEPALGGAGGPEVDVVTFRGTSSYGPQEEAGNRLAAMQELRKRMGEHGESLLLVLDVRQTPSLLGLGLVDSIPDEEILRNEDPHDADGDGVRGVASRVTVGRSTEVGRFGWKAEVPRLADFVCRALGGELGLTAPDQGRGFGLFEDADPVADPETSQDALDALDFFVATLAPPERNRDGDARQVARGEWLFERIGCAACHVPVLYGSEGPVALYSDLLLHEMQRPKEAESMQGFVKGRSARKTKVKQQQLESVAEPRFRTAPLWGVGRTAPYLHDGRAKTLPEAVLAHDVEAARAREDYVKLAPEDQAALLAFLASL